jgi:hypothetical protein
MRKSSSAVVRVASRLEIRGMVLDGGRRTLSFSGSEVFFTRQEWDLPYFQLSGAVASPDAA